MNKYKNIQSKSGFGFFALTAGICLLASTKNTHGQEALRISMAGDMAASARQQNLSSIGYYNILMGSTSLRFSSGLGLEFNDNVRLQQNGESDFIFRPNIAAEVHWPVTLKNSLDVSIGAGYSAYLQHQDLSQFFINPGSGLSFDIYAGDFKINLHDRINITENAYENTGAGGINQNLVSLQNTMGANALWDLDKIVSNFGYDHVNYISLSQSRSGQPDTTSENLFANSGIRVKPELLVGVEAGGSVIQYSQSGATNSFAISDAVQWNAGFYSSAQISDYMSVRADAGYTVFTPDSTSTNLVTRDNSGFYVSVSLSHRVNKHVNYTLSIGRSIDLSAYGQAQSYYFVALEPNWNFFKKYTFSTPVSWRKGTQLYNSANSNQLDYDQFQIGLNVSRQVTKKLSIGLSYQFVEETSNGASYNYTDNIVSLNLTYQF